MWQAEPEGVTMLDVRSFEEYVFVGHPEMAENVPLAFLNSRTGPAAEPQGGHGRAAQRLPRYQ